MKKILLRVALVLAVVVLGGGIFVATQVMAFDSSMARTYDVPLGSVQISTDPQVIERGKHLADSLGACTDCHASDLGGKLLADMGPLGTLHTPNISSAGFGGSYSDAELVRLLRHGVKRDGTGVLFMPINDFRWWPESDMIALVSWLRTQPAVVRADTKSVVSPMGKMFDRREMLAFDVARRIDHSQPPPSAPAPAETVAYGEFLGRLCTGCHGATLSGGPIPGAPPSMPVPTNLTPHETGMKRYTEESFYKTISTGIRPDGTKLAAMMPISTLAAMNSVERKALWLYLQSVPGKPFGGR